MSPVLCAFRSLLLLYSFVRSLLPLPPGFLVPVARIDSPPLPGTPGFTSHSGSSKFLSHWYITSTAVSPGFESNSSRAAIWSSVWFCLRRVRSMATLR